MPGRPNITSAKLIQADTKLKVLGETGDHPLPAQLLIFIEQGGSVARGGTDEGLAKPDTSWSIEMDVAGFKKGAANSLGVEVRVPFESTTWTQVIDIG